LHLNIKQSLAYINIDSDAPYYVSLSTPYSPQFPSSIFRIEFYMFCICNQGEIIVEIDQQEKTITKNTFVLITPASSIFIKKISPNYKISYVLFEKNFLIKDLSNPFIIEKTVLHLNANYVLTKAKESSISKLNNLLTYLYQTSQKEGTYTIKIVRTIIINILLESAEINAQINSTKLKDKSNSSNLYLQFKELIAENILQHKSVKYYAKQLNISNQHLIEVVKKSSDKTPHEIINETLLKEAIVLLGDPSLSIKQIAFLLQFNSISSFGRFFKKHTSISPSKYRAK